MNNYKIIGWLKDNSIVLMSLEEETRGQYTVWKPRPKGLYLTPITRWINSVAYEFDRVMNEADTSEIADFPLIVEAERMSLAMMRYWRSLARRLSGQVDLIDPWRSPLKRLRDLFQDTHLSVYRASTGGRWGKSSEIVTL